MSSIRHYFELPRPVYLLCLGTFINRAGTLILPMLTIYLTKHLDLPETFATIVIGVCGVGSLVAGLVGGALADHIGRRAVMLIALCGSAGMMLIFGLARAPAAILTAAFLLMLLADLYRPAASAMMADLVTPALRPTAFGLMYLAINLGFAIGPPIAGKLFNLIPAYWLFAGDALTTLAYAALIAVCIRETLHRPAQTAGDAKSPEGSRTPPATAAGAVSTAAAYARIARDVPFLLFCLATLLLGIVFMQSMSSLPLYMTRRGLGPEEFGSTIALNGLLIVLLQVPVSLIVTRGDRGLMLAAAAAVVGFGFGLNLWAERQWMFAMSIAVWTLGEMMLSPLTPAVVADLSPAALRGRYMGVFGISYAGANMLGAPLGGWVLQRFGGTPLWWGAIACCAASATLYYGLRRRIRAQPRGDAPRPAPTTGGSE